MLGFCFSFWFELTKLTLEIADLGVEPMQMTPGQFAQFITDEDKKWGKVIRDAGIKLD